MPTTLFGDEARIKQILLNVVTNAIKYTRRGSVTLAVSGAADADGSFRIVFTVTDTGIGIREEDIPFLFTAFLRVDEQANRATEGTGLGLSIVRQLLDMMGGTVSVTSTYGQGSTFCIEIPQTVTDATPVGAVDLRRAEAPTATHAQDASIAPGLAILAVDDTRMNLMVVKKLLRDTGARVEVAMSGEEALAMTRQTRYDLILMDHQMPEMDGVECLHRIHSQTDGKCRNSAVICLTANVGEEMEQLCIAEGFDAFLTKPVRGATLTRAIAQLTANAFEEDVQHCLEAGMDAHLSKPVDIDALKATLATLIARS